MKILFLKEIIYAIKKVALRSRSDLEHSHPFNSLWGKVKRMQMLPKTFSYVYAVDPSSLDYSLTSKSSTSDVIGNVVDGLLENDKLWESHSFSSRGLVSF